MEALVYIYRCIVVLLFTWLCIRIIGKKSISQMTSYDLSALIIISNVAAEPLVFKISSKAFLGSLTLAVTVTAIGIMSLKKRFYNFDAKPDIVIANGQIDKEALKRNKMNLPFILSLLRLQGYSRVSDVEFAVIEPNGNLSVIPKSQNRPVTPADLQIQTPYEGIALPLIIDGEIQYSNLKYANVDILWLEAQLKTSGISRTSDVFLAELNTSGELSLDLFRESEITNPGTF